MSLSLEERVATLRAELERDADSVLFADLPPGAADARVLEQLPAGHSRVLAASDGPRCGVIVWFDTGYLTSQQYFCDDLPGGPERWVCFGHNSDEPLVIERATGAVWWYPPTGTLYWMSGRLEKLTDTVEAFFTDYCLGSKYPQATGDHDQWYQFLTARPSTNSESDT